MVARIYDVTLVEVDFTFTDGDHAPLLKVFAKGRVNTGGWSNPELGVWSYVTAPADGVLDLDFLATPPPEGTIVTMGFNHVSTAKLLPVPTWVRGVRIHASTNHIEAMLPEAVQRPSSLEVTVTNTAQPLPWPFPWYTPPSKPADRGKHFD